MGSSNFLVQPQIASAYSPDFQRLLADPISETETTTDHL